MATRRSRSSKKFKLNLRKIRLALQDSHAKAHRAIAAGSKAIAAARSGGNRRAIAKHQRTLAQARRSKKNLAAAVRLIAKSCCDGVLNCDPDFS